MLTNIIKIVATMQLSDSRAKMHQIRFRLGIRHDAYGGTHSVPPDSLVGGEEVIRIVPMTRTPPPLSALLASIFDPAFNT